MGAEVYLIHTSVESQGSKAEEERRSEKKKKEEDVPRIRVSVPLVVAEYPTVFWGLHAWAPFLPCLSQSFTHYLIHAAGSVYDH